MEQKEQIDQIEQNISELVESDLTNTDSTEPDNPNTDVAEPNLHATHDTETERESQPNSDGSVSNLFRYDQQQLIPNCTVITLDGLDGFMWIGPDGVRHNEGLRWPTMRIEQNCTVEVLTDEYGRESKGWYKDGQQGI